MRMVLHFFEKSVYVLMIILLTGAFLPLWVRINFGGSDLAYAEGDPIIQFVLLISYSIVLMISSRLAPGILRVLIGSPMIVILLTWSFISIYWSVSPEVTLRKAIAVVMTTLFGIILSLRLEFKDFIRIMSLVSFIILGSSLLAVLILPEYAIMPLMTSNPWRGVFEHKNWLGRMALFGFLIFTWQLFLSKKIKGVWITGIVLSIFLLYMSDSRASQITLLILLGWIGTLWFARYTKKVWPSYVAGVILVLGAMGIFFFSNPELISLLTSRDQSLTGRLPLWQIVWDYIRARPLWGYGYGAFWLQETFGPSVSVMAGWEVPHAHNGFLDLWLELGLIGLVLGVLLLITSLVFWIRIYLQTGVPEALFWSTIGGFFLLYNFAESGFLRTNNIVWLFLVLMYLARNRWLKGVNEEEAKTQLILYTRKEINL